MARIPLELLNQTFSPVIHLLVYEVLARHTDNETYSPVIRPLDSLVRRALTLCFLPRFLSPARRLTTSPVLHRKCGSVSACFASTRSDLLARCPNLSAKGI